MSAFSSGYHLRVLKSGLTLGALLGGESTFPSASPSVSSLVPLCQINAILKKKKVQATFIEGLAGDHVLLLSVPCIAPWSGVRELQALKKCLCYALVTGKKLKSKPHGAADLKHPLWWPGFRSQTGMCLSRPHTWLPLPQDIWSQTWWMWCIYVPEFLSLAKLAPGLQKQGQAGFEHLIGIKVLNISSSLRLLFCVHSPTLKLTGPISHYTWISESKKWF